MILFSCRVGSDTFPTSCACRRAVLEQQPALLHCTAHSMGELCRSNKARRDDAVVPRRCSVPSCFDRRRPSAETGNSTSTLECRASAAATKSAKSRWSLGGGAVSGRSVPDTMFRGDPASSAGRVEDSRKRTRKDQPTLPLVVPHKRVSHLCSGDGGVSSTWNCSGLSWSGLRRRLSVLRRSTRRPPPCTHADSQLPANTGIINCFTVWRHRWKPRELNHPRHTIFFLSHRRKARLQC